MIMRQVIPTVLILFSLFTIWVLASETEAFWTWFVGLVAHPATLQVVLDLTISLLLLWLFIFHEHVGRGGTRGSFALFFLLTFALGVIAPLLFLTLRTFKPAWFFRRENQPISDSTG